MAVNYMKCERYKDLQTLMINQISESEAIRQAIMNLKCLYKLMF